MTGLSYDEYMAGHHMKRLEDAKYVITLDKTSEMDLLMMNCLIRMVYEGTPGWIDISGPYLPVYGYLVNLVQRERRLDTVEISITVRPTRPPTSARIEHDTRLFERIKYDTKLNNQKEADMKVYEGVILKVDDKGEPVEIVKVIEPFLAKSGADASKEVLVDYAVANPMSGKDATALQVRVREFPQG